MIPHHEAGHSTAAMMTAHCVVERIDVARPGGGSSLIHMPDGPIQAGFVLYAGPWAEVRRLWSRPPSSLDDTHDDGKSFRQMINTAFEHTADINGESDRLRYCQIENNHPGTWKNEPYWSDELEKAWPVIQVLAAALREGLDSADPDTTTFGAIGRELRLFRMPGPDAVALVQPLLEERSLWRYIT